MDDPSKQAVAEFLDELKGPGTLRDVEARMRDSLLPFADRFMKITGVAESRLARDVVNDPAYLSKVRKGETKRVTAEKYDAFMAHFMRELETRLAS